MQSCSNSIGGLSEKAENRVVSALTAATYIYVYLVTTPLDPSQSLGSLVA